MIVKWYDGTYFMLVFLLSRLSGRRTVMFPPSSEKRPDGEELFVLPAACTCTDPMDYPKAFTPYSKRTCRFADAVFVYAPQRQVRN